MTVVTPAEFVATLNTDLAVTLEHAIRHYGMTRDSIQVLGDWKEVDLVTVEIAATARSKSTRAVSFVCRRPFGVKPRHDIKEMAKKRPHMLRHLAALAEIRVLLDAPTKHWNVLAHTNPRDSNGDFASGDIPDAIYESKVGKIAIEFDASSHGDGDLRQKMIAYYKNTQLQQQWWYSATLERADEIHGQFEQTKLSPESWRVAMVDWLYG